MAIVVIGGHSRSVGKTSVVAGLISALPEYNWTALKITQYGHGICTRSGKSCHCATADHTWSMSEEKDRSGESDTSRFLVAGAEHAWWVRTEQGRLGEAVPTIRRRLAESQNAILESNSILKFLHPDIYLTIFDPGTLDFKNSAREFLGQADAIIWHGPKDSTNGGQAAWSGISLESIAPRPVFKIHPPPYVTEEIVRFVVSRLKLQSGPAFPED